MTVVVRPQEQLLVDSVGQMPAGRLLSNTVGRAQFAVEYARRHAPLPVSCWCLDLDQTEKSKQSCASLPTNLQLLCASDPPAGPFDLVVWSLSRQGDGELLRETLQLGHERLAAGGQLFASIDYPRDKWLHDQLQRLFAKVTRQQHSTGVVYVATKTTPLRKLKNYAAEFAFRDGPRLVQLRTRPGVFSHRELDGGARALLKAMRMEPGLRVLDLGCGSGAVGIAAALRAPEVHVIAVDSSARAIEATLWAAERNNAANFQAVLDCDGSSVPSASFDLVLTNPPYYSNFRLAELFLKTATRALDHRGLLLIVTKIPQWFCDHLDPSFTEVTAQPVGNYTVISAEKHRAP